MGEQNLTVGLNADLQEVVDALARGGFEVCGIYHEGFIDLCKDRPAYKVIVTKAIPKNQAGAA